ncbi:amino acid adenylation domain-containing protein [Gynuella sp.]|uniref:amino acid adenylation domain-containing protein n=1 Tax=Gynuella sp. TaxID=2969146 RepID=UPI003D13BA2C
MTKQTRSHEIARRLAALPAEQQQLFRRKLAEQGIDSWQLPIVPMPGQSALSFAQQRFVMAESMSARALYNLCSVLRFDTQLNPERLQQALSRLVQRHTILRTAYHQPEPGQWQAELLDQPWPGLQQHALSAVADEDWVQQRYEAELAEPLDLQQWPFRARLYHDESSYWLFFTVHHVAFDAWSAQILVNDLCELYQADTALPALPIQYADYAAWQRQWHHSDDYQRQRQYWQQQLSGIAPHLKLTTDYRRQPLHARDFRGDIATLVLDEALSRSLRQRIRALDSTLFIYLQTAFAWVLSRHSGQTDLCIGSSVANRGRAELATLVGPLLNTLVLRHDLSADPSFQQSLQRSQQLIAAAYDHQDLPFEHLPELLQWRHDPLHSAIIQVMFVHVALPVSQRLTLGASTAEVLQPGHKHARFDLTLRVVETEQRDEICLELEFAGELFSAATVNRWLAQMQRLLQSTLTHPQLTLSQWRFQQDRSRLAGEPLQQPPQDLLARVRQWSQQRPQAIALESGDEQLSWEWLNQRLNELSHWLQRHELQRGDRLGIALARSPLQVALMLACWQRGIVTVLLDPRQPVQRLNVVLIQADARAVVVAEQLDALQAVPCLLLEDWPAGWCNADFIPLSYEVDPCAAGELGPDMTDGPDAIDNTAAPAYLLFTSGSTGVPKGVVVSRGAVNHYCAAIAQALGDTGHPDIRWLTLATTAADLGMTSVLAALYQGQTLLLPPAELAFDPPALAEFLHQRPADCLKITPSHLKGLLSVEAPERLLPRQRLILGGEGSDIELIRQIRELAPALTIINHYGPSETTVGISCTDLNGWHGHSGRAAPLGRPLPGMVVDIRDDHGRSVPRGQAGELYIRGPQLAEGYWRQPQQTEAVFVTDAEGRWYRSGDQVRINGAGQLEFLGRADDQIKHRGYRLELGEVQQWLLSRSEVEHALVMVRQDRGRQVLVAYLQPADLKLDALKQAMQAAMPDYMVPDRWCLLDHIGLNDNGKIDRQALPWPLPESKAETSAGILTSIGTPAQTELAELWKQILGVQTVTADDDFFALGGDSILSLQLIGLAARQGVRLSPAAISAHSTLAAMATLWPQPATSATVETLLELYRDILRQPGLDADADFYQVGGDSILSLQLIARARKAGLAISPKQLAKLPTPAELGAWLDQQNPTTHGTPTLAAHGTPTVVSEDVQGTPTSADAVHGTPTVISEDVQGTPTSADAVHGTPTVVSEDVQRTPTSADAIQGTPTVVSEDVQGTPTSADAVQGTPTSATGMNGIVQGIPTAMDPIDCPLRTDSDQPVPLSPAQKRLWFLQQLEPDSRSYHVTQLFDGQGPVNHRALKSAVNGLLGRYPILRCRMFEADGEVWQQPLIQLPEVLQMVDSGDAAVVLDQALTREFDPAAGRLFYVDLIARESGHWWLLVNLHHLVTDGWSMGLLVQDFLTLYQQAESGVAEKPAAVRPDFLDWMAWQSNEHGRDRDQMTVQYWLQRLHGMPHELALATVNPWPDQQTDSGQTWEHRLDDSVTQALDRCARQLRVTPFQLLLAAWRLLLWRYSGQTDFGIGVPVAGRDHPASQQMVGLFVNTLVNRAVVLPEAIFSQWLSQCHERFQQDLEHQQLPLQSLLEALQPERNLARPPLFQTLFNYQSDYHGQRQLTLPGLQLEVVTAARSAKFELSLNLFRQQHLQMEIEFNSDLFDRPRIDAMAADYLALLQQICEQPDAPIGHYQLPSMTVPDSSAVEAIAATEDFLCRFEQQVARQPHGTAVVAQVYGGEQMQAISYQDLNRQANQLAHWLLAQGIGAEQLVAFCLPRSHALLVTLLAIQKAGAAYLPLDPDHPPQRLDYILQHAAPALLLTAETLPTSVNSVIWSVAMAEATALADDNPAVEHPPASLLYCLYTSGSTGKPKGVVVERRQFANFLTAMEQQLPRFQRVLGLTTITFDIAGLELCLPLATGATVILAQEHVRRDSEALAALIQCYEVDLIQATPSGWRLLHELPAEQLAGMTAVVGGEALDRELARRLSQDCRALFNVYGPTETTVWSTLQRISGMEDLNLRPLAPIGRALRNNQCFVLDKRLQPVPNGVTGELYIGGAAVTRGYLHQPDLTAERFLPNPFDDDGSRIYRTGDLVKTLADGRLVFVGRVDHQIKLRGFRIELGEIESQLLAHPSIAQAVVCVWPQQQWLQAYCVVTPGQDFDQAELHRHLQARLPEYMLPNGYQVMSELPLNASGKVDRKALPEPTRQGLSTTNSGVSQRVLQGASQRLLAQVWQQVLGLAEPGPDSHFFHSGGHSLLAAQVRARLLPQGWSLPLKAMFEHPRLAEMAAHMRAVETHCIPKLSHSGFIPLSHAQRRLWFMQQLEPADASFNMSFVVELHGALSVSGLQAAVDAVVDRHDILRVTYHQHEGEPVQRLEPQLRVTVQLQDLHDCSAEVVDKRLDQAASEVFDLTREAPLRVYLYQLGEQRWLCQLIQHHIASDGWSGERLVGDLTEAYRQLQAQGRAQLPPLPVQYLDYACWQHSEAVQQQQRVGLNWWRQNLKGIPAQLQLPFDHPRPERGGNEGDAVVLTLTALQTEALYALAERYQCSLFMVLAGLYSSVIYSESRSQDLVIGTDVANRELQQTEALIGFFVNLIALRFRPRATLTFGDYLQQVKQVCLSGFEHQYVPFERVVEAVRPQRIAGQHPLIQALLVMQNMPTAQQSVEGLTVIPKPGRQRHSKFDMALFASEHTEASGRVLELRWVYRRSLFEPATIRRMSTTLMARIDQAVQQPQWLSTTPMTALVAASSRVQINAMESETMSSESVSSETPPVAAKSAKLSKLSKMKNSRRDHRQSASQAPRVNVAPLSSARPLPLCVENQEPGLDPVAWANGHQQQILTWLEQYGGILFRGFDLPTPVAFEAFCQGMYPQLYGRYGDLPKKEVGQNIYQSTPYPNDQMIMFHNESSHQYRWPRRQWFYCEMAAAEGGATPIVDCREVYRRLPADIRAKLMRKELKYVRNFSNLDVSWQHFFKTDSREVVENTCREGGIVFEWYGQDNLRISQNCPAMIRHPITAEMSFFNQIQLHHVSFLEPDVREYLLRAGGEENLPRNVYYGDGEPLEQSTVDLISELYEACAVRFQWQPGDVVMVDNMLVAHARDPFKGERKMAVAMGDLYQRSDLPTVDGEEC